MPSLRQVRTQRLLTIRELARRAEVAPSTIYLIEAGRTKPLLRVIRQVAAALNVEPNFVEEFRQAMEEVGVREPPSRRARASQTPPP
jgi:transcriptional regulator with XRE-family HTH domain